MALGTKLDFQHMQLQGHTVYGSAASAGTLTLSSTSHATKGKLLFGTSAYDEVNRLGIGTATPLFAFNLVGPSSTANLVMLEATVASGFSGGTVINAMSQNTPTTTGHKLGGLTFGVRSGGTTYIGTQMSAFVAEPWTLSTLHGSYLNFHTTAVGSATLTERLRIRDDGTVSVVVGGVFGASASAALTNATVGLELQSTTKAFLPSRMTTTQRDALTAVDGMVLYNSTLAALQTRIAGAWHDVVPVAAWANWTPTVGNITGNGTITLATYIQVGKTVHFKFIYTWGSTSSITAQPNFTLPVDSTGYNPRGFAFQGVFYDVSVTTPYAAMGLRSTASLVILYQTSSSAVPTNTVPFTWATGDTIQVFGTYECV